VLVCLLVLSAVPARGEDEEPNLEFMYPLVTRRPVIEREVERARPEGPAPDRTRRPVHRLDPGIADRDQFAGSRSERHRCEALP
jgi:hypothetical protein